MITAFSLGRKVMIKVEIKLNKTAGRDTTMDAFHALGIAMPGHDHVAADGTIADAVANVSQEAVGIVSAQPRETAVT